MKNNTIICHLGVDISKTNLDIYVHPHGKHERIANESTTIQHFLNRMKKTYSHLRITCEATGGYERALIKAAQLKDIPIGVANPRRVRDFAKALGLLAKTDKIDAKAIARFGETVGTVNKEIVSASQEELASCRKRREQLIGMMTMEKNRLLLADKVMSKSIKPVLKTLENMLATLEKMINSLITQDADLLEKVTRMKTCKGVGSVVSLTLIANLPELGALNRRKIAGLVGVAPLNQDSGQRQGKRKTWGGRTAVRSSLYMAALVAVKHNPPIKMLYERLLVAGKAKKVALVACMRKLLMILNNMLKNQTDWSATYGQKVENFG